MKNRFFYLTLMLSFMYACAPDPLDVDISSVSHEIKHIDVVDNYQKAITSKNLVSVNQDLNSEAEELYEYYTAEMLRVGMPMQDSTSVFLTRFLEDSIMRIVNDKIVGRFGNFDEYMPGTVDMFKRLKYHIPNAMLPTKLLTYNSTFTNGVISTPNYIGLGLEMYLGAEDEIVKKVPFPEYFKAKMNADFLLPDMAQSWLESNVLEGATEESFLANLIYYGKVLYTIKAMLPNVPDHLILRYYESEWNWAKENEYAIWQYIVQENLVYDTNLKTILRYFKPAPSTIGFDGSPDRIGYYLGYQIILSYMNKNPDVSVKELIAEKNKTKILKSYKPKH